MVTFDEMRGTGKDARVAWYLMRCEALTKMPGWHGIIRGDARHWQRCPGGMVSFDEMRGTNKDARVAWYHSMRCEALAKMPGWHGNIR